MKWWWCIICDAILLPSRSSFSFTTAAPHYYYCCCCSCCHSLWTSAVCNGSLLHYLWSMIVPAKLAMQWLLCSLSLLSCNNVVSVKEIEETKFILLTEHVEVKVRERRGSEGLQKSQHAGHHSSLKAQSKAGRQWRKSSRYSINTARMMDWIGVLESGEQALSIYTLFSCIGATFAKRIGQELV